jgi:hypothetical protein
LLKNGQTEPGHIVNVLARFTAVVVCWIGFAAALLAAEQSGEEGEGSSVGLPAGYAKNYLIARSTISPDETICFFSSRQ